MVCQGCVFLLASLLAATQCSIYNCILPSVLFTTVYYRREVSVWFIRPVCFFLLAGHGVQLARGLVRNHNPDKPYTHLSLVTVLDRLEGAKM